MTIISDGGNDGGVRSNPGFSKPKRMFITALSRTLGFFSQRNMVAKACEI